MMRSFAGDVGASAGWRALLGSSLGAILLTGCIFLGALYVANDHERHVREAATADTANLALAFERQMATELASIERLVLRLKEAVEQQDTRRLNRLLANVQPSYGERITVASVVNANGDIIASSQPLVKPVSVAHRAHFTAHVERDTGKAVMGTPLQGQMTGKWSFHVSHRVNRADGGFGGIVSVGVDLSALDALYRQLNLGAKGFILIVGTDGNVRVQKSAAGTRANYDLRKEWPALWAALGKTSGSSVIDAAPGGARKLVSFRPVTGYPLTVAVGEDEAEVTAFAAHVRRSYLAGAAMISLLAVLMIGILTLLVRRERRRAAELALAHQRLSESEQRFRDLTEMSSDWWWEQDASGRFTYLSSAPDDCSGGVAPYIGKTCWELGCLPADTTWDAHRARLEAREPFEDLLLSHEAAGAAKYFLLSGRPVFDAQGEFTGYRGVGADITEQRRRADNLLKASDERYQHVFDASPLPMWVRDAETQQCLAVNDAALATYGYKRLEFLALSPAALLAADAPCGTAGEGQAPRQSRQTRHRTASGAMMDVELTVAGITFDARPARLVIAHDVTQRRRSEEALLESEQRLRALLDGMPDRAWLKDVQGRYVAVNRAEAQAHGRPANEIIGKTVWELRPHGRAAAASAEDQKAMASLEPLRVERASNIDGTWSEVSKAAVRGQDGTVIGLVAVSRDMTQRKRMEDALRTSEQRMRTLMDGIPDHVWLKDARGRFLAINRSYAQARGVSEAEIIGKSEFDLRPRIAPMIDAEDRAAMVAVWPKFQERVSHVDGTWREFIKLPILAPDGTVTGLLNIARDITARRLQERERHARDLEQRRALVREIHHRIKNHIMGIGGLLRGHARREPAFAPHINAAITQLQAVAVVHGLQGAHGERVVLVELLRAICTAFQTETHGGASVQFESRTVINAGLNPDEAVPVALIVNELVTNATKHCLGVAPQVKVTLEDWENGQRVCVANPGTLSRGGAARHGVPHGNGLRIVGSLMPVEGVRFDLGEDGGYVRAILDLRAPVLMGEEEPGDGRDSVRLAP